MLLPKTVCAKFISESIRDDISAVPHTFRGGKLHSGVLWEQSRYYMGNITTQPTVRASRRMKYMGTVNFQNSLSL